ncbi:MAG: aminotransferase class IV [Bacteroidota bacterium]
MQAFNPKNANIKIYVGGEIVPRDQARVSVFDSVVQGGDAVWEGLRVYDGRIFCLDKHLARLQASAKAMAFASVPSNAEIKQAVFDTLQANGMRDDVHVRLTLTRGEKTTSGMDPRLNQFGPTLIVLPEWKPPIFGDKSLRLITSSVRRNSPMMVDSKIHHNNLINNILAKIEANVAGVDAAVMLDLHGFVAEANATNLFMVSNGEVHTPLAEACLPGITRGLVMEICRNNDIPLHERRISLSEFHSADEVISTGTMSELVTVSEIDGRLIGDGKKGPMTKRLQDLFRVRAEKEGEVLPF